ncbi:MAG: cell division protein FtsZ, partial [bacterium]
GSAPIIAEIAKKNGALTIAIVTLPFNDEGIVRWENARKGLEQLQEKVDTVIVVQNDRLLDLVPDMPLNAAFKVADEILVNAVKGITELVTEKGLVNLDFADVRTIMQNGGLAMIGLGESDSESNAEEAADKALKNPLLDVEITGARSALINITGGQDLSLKSSKIIMKTIADRLDSTAKIIWGARLDESMGQSLRVMLIVTCLKTNRKSTSEIEMAIKQSGQLTHRSIELKESIDKVSVTTSLSKEPDASPESPQKQGKKVFTEIFLEESRADITILEEAVKGLGVGNRSGNEKYLREIKNACTSLYNSSELFAFSLISEFAELIGEITERALNGEFDLSESLIEIYRQIPFTFAGMVADDSPAYESAEEITQKFRNILELCNKPVKSKAAIPEMKVSNESQKLDPEVLTEDKKEDIQEDGKEEGKENGDVGTNATLQDKEDENNETELSEEPAKEDEDNGKPKFTNVREAVKFIDKLL